MAAAVPLPAPGAAALSFRLAARLCWAGLSPELRGDGGGRRARRGGGPCHPAPALRPPPGSVPAAFKRPAAGGPSAPVCRGRRCGRPPFPAGRPSWAPGEVPASAGRHRFAASPGRCCLRLADAAMNAVEVLS